MNEGMWIDVCGSLYRFIWNGRDYHAISKSGRAWAYSTEKAIEMLSRTYTGTLIDPPSDCDTAYKVIIS
jgi:hypothetical protein